jgi:hypothetical protein
MHKTITFYPGLQKGLLSKGGLLENKLVLPSALSFCIFSVTQEMVIHAHKFNTVQLHCTLCRRRHHANEV